MFFNSYEINGCSINYYPDEGITNNELILLSFDKLHQSNLIPNSPPSSFASVNLTSRI